MQVNPEDWFGAEDAANFVRWADAGLAGIENRAVDLGLFDHLEIVVPESGYQIKQLMVPEDVLSHVRDLLRRR